MPTTAIRTNLFAATSLHILNNASARTHATVHQLRAAVKYAKDTGLNIAGVQETQDEIFQRQINRSLKCS